MLDKLQVSGVMKNYLIAIDNELQENFKQMVNQAANENLDNAVTKFVDGVAALLDYYAEPIFKGGRSVVAKKIGTVIAKTIDETEIALVNEYKERTIERFSNNLHEAIVACFEDRESDDILYDEIIAIVVADCIRFFKLAQIESCVKQGIDSVKLSSSRQSCPICQTKAKFSHKTIDLLNDPDSFHPFCKLSLEINNDKETVLTIPTTNIKLDNVPDKLAVRAKNIVGTLRIYAKALITDKSFIFVNDIFDYKLSKDIIGKYGPDREAEIKKAIGSGMVLYETEDDILVSKDNCENIEYIIVSCLLKDKIKEVDSYWWRDEFAKRSASKYIGEGAAVFARPFVSYAAEQNWESYLFESVVFYILEPQLLKEIDPENYDELKKIVFNDIEFMRG